MISNRYAAELVRLLQGKQIPPQQVLHNTELEWEKLLSGEQLVRKHHMNILVNNAIRLVSEPDIGLQFGQRLNVSAHGILGFALMNCDTLGELLEVWLKYYKINYADLQLGLRVENGSAILSAAIVSEHPVQHIFAKEALFASIYSTVSFLLNEPLPNVELWLDYRKPVYADTYRSVFSLTPMFSKDQCQLRFPVELLDKKLARGNQAAARIYQQQCAEMLRTMKRRQGIARQVQQILLEKAGQFPRIDSVAKLLHVSERTLRRKLDAEGTSFQEVLNDVRYKIAGDYLELTNIGVADIAELLGFSDPSNFRRAFIQWSTVSPASYRRNMRENRQSA